MKLQITDLGFGPYVHDDASPRFPVYTRGNAGEVYPEVVFPLTISLQRTVDLDAFKNALITGGGVDEKDFDPDFDFAVAAAIFSGYTYLNLSLTRILGVRAPGVTTESLDAALLGSEGKSPPYVPHKDDKNPRRSLSMVRKTIKMLNTTSLPQLDADKRRVEAWRKIRPAAADATDDQLVDALRDGLLDVFELFEHHLVVSGDAAGSLLLLSNAVEKIMGEPSLALTMLTGIGEVESAEPARRMWDLSRLEKGSPEYDAAFAEFLVDHGPRGPNEWEMACPTWGTKPELAESLIDRLRSADEGQSPATRQARLDIEREEAIERVRAAAKPWQRSNFNKTLRAATLQSQGRERAKTTVVRLIHELRLAGDELGRRLAARAGSANPDDVFYVYWDELDDYRADPASFSERIAGRRATREALMARVPPFVFEGEMPPPTEWPLRSDLESTREVSGATLTGTAGGSGTATGIARVVTDPSQEADLGPGTILVAPHTDPSWTPLFLGVDGVVVDVGGQMSHAVIVARELGLPCVVAVDAATRRIPDGVSITVDGAAGTVTINE